MTKPTVSVAWAILAAGAVAIFVAGAWRARGGKQEVATAAVVTGA